MLKNTDEQFDVRNDSTLQKNKKGKILEPHEKQGDKNWSEVRR